MVNMIVVFGPTPESYAIGCGRRFAYQNISPTLAETIQNQGLAAPDTEWISVTQNMDNWVGHNSTLAKKHYSNSLEPTITEKLGDAKFVSFGGGRLHCEAEQRRRWFGNVDNPTVLGTIASLRQQMPDFDARLEGVIFGNGKNHLYMLTQGFVFYLDENTERKPDHPLVKVIRQFLTSGSWKILPSSTLCPWDDRYYFLNFQEEGGRAPEEQSALAVNENLKVALAISKANTTMVAVNALQQSIYGPRWY
ncbi:hypothetical protein BD779DRAFT_1673418 [Infundibulicybe gibba]|nr:hypothetical protein BD779DRAFT_1673418 [Infundibulicybe gibba]